VQYAFQEGSLGFRESLGRALDGTEPLMVPKLFILWLATVSTDCAELVPMGKVSTAIETLKKNTAKGIKCKLKHRLASYFGSNVPNIVDYFGLSRRPKLLNKCSRNNWTYSESMMNGTARKKINDLMYNWICLFFLLRVSHRL
ncbi:hypothetical protein Tco_1349041, partial [Tanacetum coccineum]